MIKAVFVDIDFTLADSNRNISKENINSIKKCVDKGIKIILTSGRSRLETINRQEEVGSSPYIISANGAEIYNIKKEEEIYSEYLDKSDTKKLLQYSLQNDFQIRLIYQNNFVSNKKILPDEKHKLVTANEIEKIIENNKIIQCVICNQDIEKQRSLRHYVKNNFPDLKIINESKKLTDDEASPSKIYYCDITSKNVSKGKSVLKFCKYFNINPEEIITIGDSDNDLSMFKVTPNSIAMGNASVEIKHKANYTTLSNNDNGVAKVLNNL